MVLNIISIGTITILNLSFTQSSSDGNITVSSVILKPTRRQSGQVVNCRVKIFSKLKMTLLEMKLKTGVKLMLLDDNANVGR